MGTKLVLDRGTAPRPRETSRESLPALWGMARCPWAAGSHGCSDPNWSAFESLWAAVADSCLRANSKSCWLWQCLRPPSWNQGLAVEACQHRNSEALALLAAERCRSNALGKSVAKWLEFLERRHLRRDSTSKVLMCQRLLKHLFLKSLSSLPKYPGSQAKTGFRRRRLDAGRRVNPRMTGCLAKSCIGGTDSASRHSWENGKDLFFRRDRIPDKMREKIAEVPVPRVIVEVPRTLGQIGEVARLFSHEGVQQLKDEQLVDMPVPQILEDIVEVGSPLPQ